MKCTDEWIWPAHYAFNGFCLWNFGPKILYTFVVSFTLYIFSVHKWNIMVLFWWTPT